MICPSFAIICNSLITVCPLWIKLHSYSFFMDIKYALMDTYKTK